MLEQNLPSSNSWNPCSLAHINSWKLYEVALKAVWQNNLNKICQRFNAPMSSRQVLALMWQSTAFVKDTFLKLSRFLQICHFCRKISAGGEREIGGERERAVSISRVDQEYWLTLLWSPRVCCCSLILSNGFCFKQFAWKYKIPFP